MTIAIVASPDLVAYLTLDEVTHRTVYLSLPDPGLPTGSPSAHQALTLLEAVRKTLDSRCPGYQLQSIEVLPSSPYASIWGVRRPMSGDMHDVVDVSVIKDALTHPVTMVLKSPPTTPFFEYVGGGEWTAYGCEAVFTRHLSVLKAVGS